MLHIAGGIILAVVLLSLIPVIIELTIGLAAIAVVLGLIVLISAMDWPISGQLPWIDYLGIISLLAICLTVFILIKFRK